MMQQQQLPAIYIQFFIVFSMQYLSNAQLCSGTPTDDEVKTIFSNLLSPSLLPEGALLGGGYYTCMAQASQRFRYRELSVIITYTHNDMVTAKQFEIDCVMGSNTWMGRVGSVTDVPPSFNYTSITTRTDCSSCSNTADNDHHCEACDPACNTDLMRCTGPGSGDCCSVYSGLSCAANCGTPEFIALEFTEFQCNRLPCPTLPDDNTTISLLRSSQIMVSLIRSGPYYTCLVQGAIKGRYDALSLVVEYTDSSGRDKVGHLYAYCEKGQWTNNGYESRTFHELPGPNYNGSIGLRTDCSRCLQLSSNYKGLESPCTACPDHCGVGLNRCGTRQQCCVAFEDNGFCKTNLNCDTDNFVANENNNYTCSCGLSCPDGYTVNSTICATCKLTDICIADNPCNNNGVCILDTAPDQYTCNCTGTGYTGTNCTECSLTSCPRGYVVNDCMCVLDDICVADNPCSNGGSCVLGSPPHQYSCQCIDYYTGTNCTECVVGYTGSNCSECDTGYSINREGSCTLMMNGTSSGTGLDNDSSFKWWHIGLPIIILVVLLLVIVTIVIIVGVVLMRNKQEKHDITSNETILKPQ